MENGFKLYNFKLYNVDNLKLRRFRDIFGAEWRNDCREGRSLEKERKIEVVEGNLKAVLIGTITCADLSAAFAIVREHGLAVFGTTSGKLLRELGRIAPEYPVRNRTKFLARFYFCAPTCALPHVAVAAGWLAGFWTEVPEEASLAVVKESFQKVFGLPWEKVVVGRERERLFRFWEGYVAVAAIKSHPGVTVARIREENPEVQVLELLLG